MGQSRSMTMDDGDGWRQVDTEGCGRQGMVEVKEWKAEVKEWAPAQARVKGADQKQLGQ